MGVDEARCHDVAGGIQRFLASKRILGDRDNSAILDTDIGDIVEQRLRVDDPAVEDDDVVVLSKC